MRWNTLPYRSRIEAVVEEHDKRSPPEAPDGHRMIPTSGPLHSMRCEIEGVDFSLGEVVSAGNTSLRPWLRKSRKHVDHVAFPCPRHDCSKILASLVCSTARIGPPFLNGTLVNPIERVTGFSTREFLDWHAATSFCPFSQRGQILLASSNRRIPSTEVTSYGCPQIRRHRLSSRAAGTCCHARSFPPVASRCTSCGK